MIIELFGLPGAGKSTLARALESTGRVRRIRIESKGELLWRSAVYAFGHPLDALMQLSYLIRYAGSPERYYTKFMNLFLQHAAKYQKARSAPGTAVVDQGHLQNLLSLFEHSLSHDELMHYLKFLPKPDQVWVCEASDEERERRLQARGQDRTSESSVERARAARENFATSLSILSGDPSFSVRVITAGQDSNALVV